VATITDSVEDLRLAFDAVEGEGYFDRQEAQPGSNLSLAQDAWDSWIVKLNDLIINDPEEATYEVENSSMSPIRNGTIYGSGGWHRYFVTKNGDIVFSAGHATEEGIARAMAAGFRIWR